MALLSLQDISLTFGGVPLLEKANLQIEPGEKVCLIGRNGTGKTTLFKIISGEIKPDTGRIIPQSGLKIGRLPQKIPSSSPKTVFESVAEGTVIGNYLIEYKQFLAGKSLSGNLDHQSLHREIEKKNGWETLNNIEKIISRMELDPEATVSTLSGGVKRRVFLARALAGSPQLLLLDEPTNHLDIKTIKWLEEFLQKLNKTIFFISHDRKFLDNLAQRIVELDRGQLIDWNCNYQNYLKRKEEAEEAEARQIHNFEKKLQQEEEWIRQGIKARRRRNMGRVRSLQEMREKKRKRRSKTGQSDITIESAQRSGNVVIKAKNISFSRGSNKIIKDFSLKVTREDRIGLIGPNGCGKSTLLQLLLKKLEPDQGSVKLGTNVEINYFDQLREKLDEEKTVKFNIAQEKDFIIINGKKKHIFGYLKQFLFSPERANSPVSHLSGGEKNRLLLAKLFTRPSNLLVLDEPTNDLDLETLELLEDRISQFQGTILLVSHDRQFLNNVVSSTLVFEGEGQITEYIGGYDDYLSQAANSEKSQASESVNIKTDKKAVARKIAAKKQRRERKLTYREKEEFAQLPAEIEKLEKHEKELEKKLSDPALYRDHPEKISELNEKLNETVEKLEVSYERWSKLEEINS
ncbi:MAG: ATP-binding cassette domain-containing protein [Deltaproteobacteria bacterium]|jgi:ATP-binding cassette subfamily F protein uup|nr:ATP-binding cassette domain-containing protein [Deltaproteobacteria bacterium]